MMIQSDFRLLFFCIASMCFFGSMPVFVEAQNREVVDSLTGMLEGDIDEETRVKALRDLFWEYERADPEKAKSYIEESISIAQKLNDNTAVARGKYAFSGYYEMKGDYDQAILLLNEAMSSFQKVKDTLGINDCLLDIGQNYFLARNYEQSLDHYLQAIDGFTQLNNEGSLARAYNSVGNLYKAQERYQEALESYEKALAVCEKLDIKIGQAVCSNNLGIVHQHLKEYDKSREYYENALDLYTELGDKFGVAKANNNLGMNYSEQNKYEAALPYHQKALDLYTTLNNKEGITIANINVGYDFGKLKQFDKGIFYLKKAEKLSSVHGYKDLSSQIYANLSSFYADKKDYIQAFEYQVKYKSVEDSLNARINDEKILELQAQYESGEKEKQITLLQKENEINELKLGRSRFFNIAGIIGTLLATIIFFILFRNYKHRRNLEEIKKLRARDIKVLDMKRKLIKAVVDTEEKERKRISGDLHDELGPLLSSLQLYLGEIKETKEEEQEEFIDMAQDTIDEAFKELRHIVKNLLPTSISEKGLIEALKLFYRKIEATGAVQIHLDHPNSPLHINQAEELILYRVITELTNNTLKHAEAKNIFLEIEDNKGSIIVEYRDDGNGFDIKNMHDNGGVGLKNMQERIQSLNGTIDILSKINKGMSVIIKIESTQ